MQHKTMKNGNFELNTIFNLDCVEGLAQMQPESVDFVLTSPPYDNLRRYGDLSAWNFEKFQEVAQLLAAVIKPGGVIVWVVGDSTVNGSETGSSFRQALYFKDNCSLNLYDTMIFAKSNPIPGNQRRYQQAFEYMFVFSKGTPTAFNPIVEKCQQFGRSQQWGRSNNLAEKTAKHLRANDIRITKENKLHSNIFTYGVGSNPTGHPAVFPLKLALEMVATWSNPNDTVLDPFSGSGTTAVAAIQLQRNFIGFEINPDYYAASVERIKQAQQQLTIKF